jgi:uncharacterized protein YdiU (UPF0061 family)
MSAIDFNNSYAALPDTFFAKQNADLAPNPSLIMANADLAETLNINPAFLTSDDGLAMFAGNIMPEGADPLAMAYAGHQFGGWSPQLGDGRALLLGEVIGTDGIRYDIQLKGSGRTPFSRGGDGKAAIGPVIREYIVSEAMAALGVPTTRALAAVTTGEDVIREGRLPGAIVTRVAQSHVRVGTFQYFYAKNDAKSLQVLADYMIDRHYPEARNARNPIQAFYASVVARQAKLIALWLKFGFIHGVMNTDNCQIAGETIDYGPCAFMDDFNPNKVFSSIDQQSRYAWGKQPTIAHWNLTRLGEALIPIWGKDDDAAVKELQDVLDGFSTTFTTHFHEAFAQKLGLQSDATQNPKFFETTFQTMTTNATDFTLFFSHLRRITQEGHRSKFVELFKDPKAAENWLELWQAAKNDSGITRSDSQDRMDVANPIYIPRNHRVEEAIAAGTRADYEPFHKLHAILQNPFEQQTGADAYEDAPQPEEVVHQTFCGT